MKGLFSMASVTVSWSGKCDNREIQKNLCNNLKEIAELSHSYFKDITPVRYFSHTVEGRIIIDGGFFDAPLECSHLERITQLKLKDKVDHLCQEIFQTGEEGIFKEPRDLFIAKEVNLYGLEFLLFDPRDCYFSYNGISFVFASIDSCPSFNGLLVEVRDRKECLKSTNSIIKDADWFLTEAGIHLRYYCEHWTEKLLGYIKYFYIPNLYYRADGSKLLCEDLSGNDRFLKFVSEFGGKEAESKILNMLKEELKDEINSWSRLQA